VELDAAGQVMGYEELHPYGTSAYRVRNAAVGVPRRRYRFTGLERDDETGPSYHGARYYAPTLGVWAGGRHRRNARYAAFRAVSSAPHLLPRAW
jgi:RHS repeat-associated protein